MSKKDCCEIYEPQVGVNKDSDKSIRKLNYKPIFLITKNLKKHMQCLFLCYYQHCSKKYSSMYRLRNHLKTHVILKKIIF